MYPKKETSMKQVEREAQILGVLSQKIEFFTARTVRNSDPTSFFTYAVTVNCNTYFNY
jgi:hypothetical protein